MDRRAFLSLTAGAAATLCTRRALASAQLPSTDNLTRLTLQEAATRVRQREVSPVELTRACLARIEQYDSKINAFITVSSRLALEQAQTAEQEIRDGQWRGPLHGIPIAVKDSIDTAGIRTTSGNAKFIDRIPTQDAEVVRRLKQSGAVMLGKLNIGPTDSHWGPIHNPWALDYECSYSSSGPGAAVAADFCFGALGTDGAGSVRMPASACSLVGLKPTYGLISNRGVSQNPLSHVGPLCKTVLDTALLLRGVAGHDAEWGDSARVDLPDYAAALREDRKAPRLGIPKAGFFDRLDPEVAQLTDVALKTMSTLGTIDDKEITIPLYWEILQGVYGESLVSLCEQADTMYQLFIGKRPASALQECVGGVDPAHARRALQEARRHAAEFFKGGIDLLVLPTWKRLPMTIEERKRTYPPPKEVFMHELWNCMPFNVLGLPAISVPCGYAKHGLPVGIQIVGRPFAESQVLAFAQSYEQATTWHSRKPKLRKTQ